MSADVSYSYCSKLTDEEKIKIDEQVRKNRLALKRLKVVILVPLLQAMFFPLPFVNPEVPFYPVEGFVIPEIIKEARERAEAVMAYSKKDPVDVEYDDDYEQIKEMYEACKAADEEYKAAEKKFKVIDGMSPTLSKLSEKIRADHETAKALDTLEEDLKDGKFHTGRGSQKLENSKTIFYARAGNKARLYYTYVKGQKRVIEKIAETNKEEQDRVIKNLQRHYK